METGRPTPMFPLSTVLFPHAPMSLHVFEPRYRAMTAECLAGDREFGVVLITRGWEVGGTDERAGVGTVARIEQAAQLPDGRSFLQVVGRRPISVVEWLPDGPYPQAVVVDVTEDDRQVEEGAGSEGADRGEGDRPTVAPVLGRALSAVRLARGLLSEAGRAPALVLDDADLTDDPVAAGWRLCHAAPVGPLDRQRLLEARGLGRRMDLLASLCSEVAEDLARMLAGG